MFSIFSPGLTGIEDLGTPDPPELDGVDILEVVAHGSAFGGSTAITAALPFTGSDQRAAVFTFGAVFMSTYFTRPLPDVWQGQTIEVQAWIAHTTGSLTGAGSPPDDQVKIEFGYETLADATTYVDLGVQNDATAPHETDSNIQLGTTQQLFSRFLVASILVGATDRFLHCRFTRDANDADDGLSGVMYLAGLDIFLPPP